MKGLSKEELLLQLELIHECIDYQAYQQIRQLIENQPTKEKLFVRHIENHLKEMKIRGKVICKICGKDIDEIYKEARIKIKKK